jgi:nucleotide-binding universal stress UspA family protein
MPGVRRKLEEWGSLPPGSAREDVEPQLGILVKKQIIEGVTALEAVELFSAGEQTDFIVLSTARRQGLSRWLEPSAAEAFARQLRVPALFLGPEDTGFIDAKTGNVTLSRVLVPIADSPDPEPALDVLLELLDLLDVGPCRIDVLHVVDGEGLADTERSGGRFELVGSTRAGVPEQVIVQVARESSADLLVMPTAGRHGFLDVLRGSVSERVLREAPCPVLTVPSA